MPTTRHIQAAAEHLVKQHGGEARRFATITGDRLTEGRDDAGASYWRSIADVVKGIEAGIATTPRQPSRDLAF